MAYSRRATETASSCVAGIIDAINCAAERFQAGEFPISGRTALIVCGLFVAAFLAQLGWWSI